MAAVGELFGAGDVGDGRVDVEVFVAGHLRLQVLVGRLAEERGQAVECLTVDRVVDCLAQPRVGEQWPAGVQCEVAVPPAGVDEVLLPAGSACWAVGPVAGLQLLVLVGWGAVE